jgi:hypothetical protein
MKKQNKLTAKDFILEIHDKYRAILGLNLWGYKIDLSKVAKHTDDRNGTTLAEISQNRSYLKYTITIYPELIKMYDDKKNDEVKLAIVHELCHILTEPLYDIAINSCPPGVNFETEREREKLTETLAKFICKYEND